MTTTHTPSRLRAWLEAVLFRLGFFYLGRKVRKHLRYFAGSANIPQSGPFIVVPNHQSYFDTFSILGLLWFLRGIRVRIPTNVKAFRGWHRRLWQEATGAVAIDPAVPDSAYQTIGRLLDAGEVVIVFPEGTRSDGSALLPFRFGAFNLAVEKGVPILPVGLRNAGKVLPKGSYRFRGGEQASVIFGEALAPPPVAETRDPAAARAAAARLCDDTRGVIEDLVYGDVRAYETADARLREAQSVAASAEAALERLLDNGVENLTTADAESVLAITSLADVPTGKRCLALEVQHVRAFGFWVASRWSMFAGFYLPKYRRLLRAALALDADHPYLNYSLGQYHLKVPRWAGGDPVRARQAMVTAYGRAEAYGMDRERFAFGYASALARVGDRRAAARLLSRHFANAASFEGTRRLRRRRRALDLLTRLEAAA